MCQVGAVNLMICRAKREMLEFGATEILGLFSPFQKSLFFITELNPFSANMEMARSRWE